jgi:hypothetical protein
MKILIAAVLIGATMTSGCATIIRGSSQTFNVASTPTAASVTTSNGYACEATPCSFDIKRKATFGITISKPGYKTFSTQVGNRISGRGGASAAGNVIAGGVVGLGVDAITGASLDLNPNPMRVILEPIGSSAESRLEPVATAQAKTGT